MEYFEDLRNINHCEFITMERNESTGKYLLQANLRTWSAYKKEQEAKRVAAALPAGPAAPNGETMIKDNSALSYGKEEHQVQEARRWGGCVNGCNHAKYKWYTYGEPNTNNANGDNYGKAGKRTPAEEMCLVQSVQNRLRERLEVLGAGRDFGGSRSGAGSDVEDDTGSGSGGEDDLLEQVKKRLHDKPAYVSNGTGGDPGHGVNGGGYAAAESTGVSAPPNTAVPIIEVCKTVTEKRLEVKQRL